MELSLPKLMRQFAILQEPVQDALISQTEFTGDYHTAPAKLCCSTGNRYAPALNPKRPLLHLSSMPWKSTFSSDVITVLPASEDLVSTLEVAFAAQFSGAKQQGRKMRERERWRREGGRTGEKANYPCLKQME